MNTEKLIAGAFAIVLGGLAVKTFKTIITEYKNKDKEESEDEC